MAQVLKIQGGKPLQGTAVVSGSKNGSLPTLAACLLMEGRCRLENVPRIGDVETMLELLRHCGARVERDDAGAVIIDTAGVHAAHISCGLAEKMRASYYLIGPLVGRFGATLLPNPGGCNLGSRPVDYILRALEPLGFSAGPEDGHLVVRGGPAKGGRVILDAHYRSPGATFTVIMAACLGSGTTIIENACSEPDVVSFCEFLNRAGAKIQGIGTSAIEVDGVKRLSGVTHRVNGDRLEAGTLLLASAASRGEVFLQGIKIEDLRGFFEPFEESGAETKGDAAGVRAICRKRPSALNFVTTPFPGFPTDLQPPMMAFLAQAEGTSRIEERIFDGRMGHVEELRRMGALIEVEDRVAIVKGVPKLHGAQVEMHNIRVGAALVVAAVGAEGETTLRGLEHLERGYEKLEKKLAALGAQVQIA